MENGKCLANVLSNKKPNTEKLSKLNAECWNAKVSLIKSLSF